VLDTGHQFHCHRSFVSIRIMTELVIFDCDGVLVDSEGIGNAVLAQAATREGAEISAEEALHLFRGLKMAECVVEIERRSGRRVRDDFVADLRRAMAVAFETELRAVAGIREALAAITLPVCVASNGPMSKMTHTLGLTGLLDHFEGRIFSAYDVGAWKPDPGLFLHAARSFGAEPSRCVVVEDSLSGIRAANAAGMRVLGYTAGDACAVSELGAECADLFHSMAELPTLLFKGVASSSAQPNSDDASLTKAG
jgi:HAD superfamily hydrolase (TIGR01509 family)